MDEKTFRVRYDELAQLINQRGFVAAIAPTYGLARDSNRAEAWFMYNLAICLTNKHGGARRMSPKLIKRIQACPDYTVIVEGDARRDRLNALVVRRPRRSSLRAAENEAVRIKWLHRGDANRLCCLTGSLGRLAYAKRQYGSAVKRYKEADDKWNDLGDKADKQWVYNNLIHWLKAEVKHSGLNSVEVTTLRERIANECPEGAKNRSGEADRICMPRIGNWLDDMARAFAHLLPQGLRR